MNVSNKREEVKVPGVPEPISHYTPVVRAGRMVFISGMEPKDEKGATGRQRATSLRRRARC
jgi:enamine deaminase RidA (YjgF/YER057c/UK114 family)